MSQLIYSNQMENPRKPVEKRRFTETIVVRNYLSKYQYKQSLANKHPKSLIFNGKLTQKDFTTIMESNTAISSNVELYDKLYHSINQYTIVYVRREYQNPVSR